MREQRTCPGAQSSISTRLLRDPLCSACSTFCGAKPLLVESASARTAPVHPSSQKSPGLWQLQRQQQIESQSSLPAIEIVCEDELLDIIPEQQIAADPISQSRRSSRLGRATGGRKMFAERGSRSGPLC